MTEFSLIIPCFNEEKNILPLLERVKESFERLNFELILVNNGSTDSTGEILSALKENFLFVSLVNVEVNQGYGFGILKGLEKARGKVLAWSHADLQTDLADVAKGFMLYREINDERAILKGERKGRPFLDSLMTYGMTLVVWIILGEKISDINAQPKIFSRFFYENYLILGPPNDFSLDLYLLVCAKKANSLIHSFPVYFHSRVFGVAKGGGAGIKTRLKIISRTLSYIIKLRSNANHRT